MADCIFCQIVKGDVPCFKVYEDDSFLGFLDISPFSPGHTILIPKIHYRWVYDVSRVGQYWESANLIAHSILKIIKPDYISFWTFGNEVEHAHIHIVPRFNGDKFTGLIKLHHGSLPPQEMARIAAEMLSLIK